jgi:hypothetical protein
MTRTDASIEGALIEWAAQLRFEDLPEDAVVQSKRLLLDTLAFAWAGAGAEASTRYAGLSPIRAAGAIAVFGGGKIAYRVRQPPGSTGCWPLQWILTVSMTRPPCIRTPPAKILAGS